MIGDARETHLQPPPEIPVVLPVDRLLDYADEIQQMFLGSFVELIVRIPNSPYTGEVTDNYRLYSVRLENR
jgi:hypothetical protein